MNDERTPEQTAKDLMDHWLDNDGSGGVVEQLVAHEARIAAAISEERRLRKEAVEREREECAKVARDMEMRCRVERFDCIALRIEESIRSRGKA